MTDTPRLEAPPTTKTNALKKFTLAGRAAELEEKAIQQKPLIGAFSLTGQSTVISAPPNAGKTLITLAMLIEAIDEGRIEADNVIYVNSDDTTNGIVEKLKLLDEYGVHVVAEGYQGFRSNMLAPALDDMVKGGAAHGSILILDTLKKFAQVMSKPETVRFTETVRRFILAGGSLICLAHTNKKADATGRNVFAGVADIVDDLDAAYVLDLQPDMDGKRIVKFTNIKRRGNSPDTILYAYDASPERSYLERLTSVHETDRFAGGDDTGLDPHAKDDEIVDSLCLYIKHGPNRGKMELVKLAAEENGASKQRVLKLLEAHTGDDPIEHKWRVVVKAHGKHTFELHRDCFEPEAA